MENINEIDRSFLVGYDDENETYFSTNDVPFVLSRQNSKRYLRPDVKGPSKFASRLISKSGKSNVSRTKLSNSWFLYIKDFSNTLVASRWRWTLISLASCFIASWLLFAWFYMLVANSNAQLDLSNNATCFMGIDSFYGYFLFSIETQATIGYGSRLITRHCPEAVFLLCLQIIWGCAICGGIASIVLVKMSRPLAQYSKSLFSKNAVICRRDGEFCLMFRVRDNGYRHIIGTSITAHLVQFCDEELALKTVPLEPYGLLIWPLEIVHKITPSSPFWNLSAKDLITKRFELVVTMQGTSATTSQCTKTVTSYVTSEILWGQRFKPCVSYNEDMASYCVDHKQFNKTEEVLTPLCSGQRLQEVLMDVERCTLYSINENNSPIREFVANQRTDFCDNCRDDIDSDVYSFLSDIKDKLHGENSRKNTQKPSDLRGEETTFDVESLIDNLRKYVDENVNK